MHLNEVDPTHNHASTSLKTILLTFVIVMIAALGYFVWQQNTAIYQIDESSGSVTRITTSSWKTFKNPDYLYSISYPSAWPIAATDLNNVIIGNVTSNYTEALVVAIHPDKTALVRVQEFNADKVNYPDGCEQPQSLLVASLPATKISCHRTGFVQDEIHYFVTRGRFTYDLSYFRQPIKGFNAIFEQMVRTFNFD